MTRYKSAGEVRFLVVEINTMSVPSARIALVCVVLGVGFIFAGLINSQEIRLQQPDPQPQQGEVPKGVEVLTRGPIHEAFASPQTEPKATPQIAKKPPAPIEEMPPEERPEGDVIWIGGYWGWDDDRADYLWVSGCWRAKPTGKEWVPGYWREVGSNWQWVPGFWSNAPEAKAAPTTYHPEPPAPPNVAPVADDPTKDTMYIPGYWMWTGDRYAWRAGYWTRVRPGYVYVPSHYRWTPYGYIFVSGYWDYTISRRGLLYAPVTVDVAIVGVGYRHTPYYAVRDTIVLDSMFIRPAFGAYYFGDYYGPRYVGIGFEPAFFYSRRHYEPIIVYERWNHREDPRWFDARLTLVVERNAGRAALPPRTLALDNRHLLVAPARTVVVAHGGKVVALDAAARARVHEMTKANQHAMAAERRKLETAPAGAGPLTKARTAPLTVASTPHVGATTTATDKGTPKTGTDTSKSTSVDKGPTHEVGRDPKVGPKDRPVDTKKGADDKKKKG
jgi:WXXGXW repeat (2 copies)